MKYYISIIILTLCLVLLNKPIENTQKKELPQKEMITNQTENQKESSQKEVVSNDAKTETAKEEKQVSSPKQSTPYVKKEDTAQPKQETIKKETPVEALPEITQNESSEETIYFSSSQQAFIRSHLLTSINNQRTSAVTLYQPLLKSSSIRAKEAYQSWSHTRPNGSRWNTTLQGITDIKYVLHGENLAKTQIEYKETYSDNDLISLCQSLHQGLVNSPTHYAVMTNENYKKVNIGIYTYQNHNMLTVVIAQHYMQ